MAKNKTLIGHIKGPKGDPGEKGEPGEKGTPGTDGTRGNRWTTGNKIFGTNTTPAVFDTGIEDSLVNDHYLNEDTGDVYCCTKSGDSSIAEWVWATKLKTDSIDAYTKTESDEKYAVKDDLVDAYTKTESDETFLKKTDSIDAYTKTESDETFLKKTDSIDAYTKAQSDNKYVLKSDYSAPVPVTTSNEVAQTGIYAADAAQFNPDVIGSLAYNLALFRQEISYIKKRSGYNYINSAYSNIKLASFSGVSEGPYIITATARMHSALAESSSYTYGLARIIIDGIVVAEQQMNNESPGVYAATASLATLQYINDDADVGIYFETNDVNSSFRVDGTIQLVHLKYDDVITSI